MTEREMLSCPFCGDNPSYEVMDRMIVIGCEPCGYQRAFPGLLQAEVSAVRVSEREFYHADATDKAVEGWNQRLALAQPVAAEPAVSEADISAAREHIADVHNAEQLRSALGQLRRDVVIEMAARGLAPSYYGKPPTPA